MSNIKCKNCGEISSSSLEECPNCGFKNEEGIISTQEDTLDTKEDKILHNVEANIKPITLEDNSWVNTYLSKKRWTKIGNTIAFLLIVIITIIISLKNSNNENSFLPIIFVAISFLMGFIWFKVLIKVKVYANSCYGYIILVYSGVFDKSLIIENEVIDSSLTHKDKVAILPNGKEIILEPYIKSGFRTFRTSDGKYGSSYYRKCKGYFLIVDAKTHLMDKI